jgi:hypothetical protein
MDIGILFVCYNLGWVESLESNVEVCLHTVTLVESQMEKCLPQSLIECYFT